MTTRTTLLTFTSGPEPRRTVDVEIVIPVYNEQAGLGASIRRLHEYLEARFPLSWLVTIADNASTDHTWGIACRLSNELRGVRAIHLDRKGRGRALRAVWSTSTAPVVAYMDADLSTDLDALLPLVAPLVSGHSDVAIGTRLAPGSRVVRGPRREAISRGYNVLLRATLGSCFSDAQCGFKALRTDVGRVLLPMVEDDDWFFDTELLVLAEHNGMRIHEVPVDWVDDPASQVDVFATAKEDLCGIWRMARSIATGRVSITGLSPRPASIRPAVAPANQDLAGQLVRFASIGVVSSVLFALLFVLLDGPLGVYGANLVALAACTVANTAANRRLTFALRGRTGRARHHLAGLAVGALPLVLTTLALLLLRGAGITSTAVLLIVVTMANLAAALARFALLRRWVFRPEAARRPSPAVPSRRSALVKRLRQFARYTAVSAISTVVTLSVLGLLVVTSAIPVLWANIVASAIGTVPSFELNRRWVWAKRGHRSMGTEIIPFCALQFAGLVLSTVAVVLTARWAEQSGLDATARSIVADAANLATYGTLWLIQFVILDRVLFGRRSTIEPSADVRSLVGTPAGAGAETP
jgi:putative flippase GtrA